VLLAVLCLVAVISFIIITAAAVSKQHGETQHARQGGTRARQLAEMGIAVGAHPQLKPGDPLLRREISAIERFETVISTEEGRLNLNALLTEERLPILERVFASWGLSPADAQGIAATLMDWTDADDLKRRPDSAEKLDYERQGWGVVPLNRLFNSLNEVAQVPRMVEVAQAKPNWRSVLTLRGDGRLDIHTASAQNIAAVTGVSLENADMLVQKRQGPDGIANTPDDFLLSTLEEAMAILGFQGKQAEVLMPLLTLAGPTRRVESIGTAGDAMRGIAVVIRDEGGVQHLVEWREFSVEAERSL
jgi:type II secretory pathway component PulK